MAVKAARVLNMKKLIADVLKGKFEPQIPDHFIKENQTIIPGTAEEKLEETLVMFCTTYLNTCIAPESVAKRYKVQTSEVIRIREKWAEKLSHYFE